MTAVDPAVPTGAVPVPTIRPMDDTDLDRVLALEWAIYPEPWSEGIFRDELAMSGRTYLVAEVGGVVVAFAGLMVVEEDGHITTVTVDPDWRRRRLATRLMTALVELALVGGARHLTLEVRASNRSAQRLYTRFGLAPVGMRQGYYGDEDALIMWATDIDRPPYRARLDAIVADVEARRG